MHRVLPATFSKTFLPDTSWSTNSVSNNYTSTNKHAFNFTVETTIDSSNTLKWTTKANENKTLTRSNYYTESFTDDLDSINNSRRNSNNKAVNDAITTSLLWRHKFKKLSRTLSINADLNWNRSKNDGLLYSLNNYYENGVIDRPGYDGPAKYPEQRRQKVSVQKLLTQNHCSKICTWKLAMPSATTPIATNVSPMKMMVPENILTGLIH